MSQLRNSGYVKESERRACHGFFPTEETANDAKEWLKKNCCRREDDVFKQKVDSKLLYFIEENGYKTVNGFIDKAWWCARDW